MMERDAAWTRVQLALDERRDPLEDERLQEWFAERPDELAALVRLESRLARLPAPRVDAPMSPTRPVARLVATVAAGVLVTAGLVALLVARGKRGADPLPPVADDGTSFAARVVDYRLSVTRDSGDRRFHATRAMHEPLSITNTTTRGRSPAQPGVQRLQHTLETETNR